MKNKILPKQKTDSNIIALYQKPNSCIVIKLQNYEKAFVFFNASSYNGVLIFTSFQKANEFIKKEALKNAIPVELTWQELVNTFLLITDSAIINLETEMDSFSIIPLRE